MKIKEGSCKRRGNPPPKRLEMHKELGVVSLTPQLTFDPWAKVQHIQARPPPNKTVYPPPVKSETHSIGNIKMVN